MYVPAQQWFIFLIHYFWGLQKQRNILTFYITNTAIYNTMLYNLFKIHKRGRVQIVILNVSKQKNKIIITARVGKVKSAKKVTKRAQPLPVLHFLFLVYDYIMECDLLCVTADCGQPRWSIARIVLKGRQDHTRIQNGVVFFLRGNSFRPQHEIQSECSSLPGPVSARVSILKSKAARSEIGRMGWRRGLNRNQNMIF